jgi:hypothetical protein
LTVRLSGGGAVSRWMGFFMVASIGPPRIQSSNWRWKLLQESIDFAFSSLIPARIARLSSDSVMVVAGLTKQRGIVSDNVFLICGLNLVFKGRVCAKAVTGFEAA